MLRYLCDKHLPLYYLLELFLYTCQILHMCQESLILLYSVMTCPCIAYSLPSEREYCHFQWRSASLFHFPITKWCSTYRELSRRVGRRVVCHSRQSSFVRGGFLGQFLHIISLNIVVLSRKAEEFCLPLPTWSALMLLLIWILDSPAIVVTLVWKVLWKEKIALWKYIPHAGGLAEGEGRK